LIEAVTEFAARAAIKLRTQKSLVNQVLVFAHTSPFKPVARFSRNCVVPLPAPTGDTRQIVGAAVAGVRRMFEPGYQLSKAGVILLDLQPEGMRQGMLDVGDSQEVTPR
jgi:DNA polymerase V